MAKGGDLHIAKCRRLYRDRIIQRGFRVESSGKGPDKPAPAKTSISQSSHEMPDVADWLQDIWGSTVIKVPAGQYQTLYLASVSLLTKSSNFSGGGGEMSIQGIHGRDIRSVSTSQHTRALLRMTLKCAKVSGGLGLPVSERPQAVHVNLLPKST